MMNWFFLVIETFKIDFDKDAELYLCTQKGYQISRDSFGTVVSQYINCSDFEIKIRVESDVNDVEFHKVARKSFRFNFRFFIYIFCFVIGIGSIFNGRRHDFHLRGT